MERMNLPPEAYCFSKCNGCPSDCLYQPERKPRRRRSRGENLYRISEALKDVGVWLAGSVFAVLAVWKAAELLASVVVYGW